MGYLVWSCLTGLVSSTRVRNPRRQRLITTGPNDLKVARPQVVHLVSLEHLDGALNDDGTVDGLLYDGKAFQAADPNSRFAMVSLYSWIVSCV